MKVRLIAEDLGVRYVLEGSVHRAANRLDQRAANRRGQGNPKPTKAASFLHASYFGLASFTAGRYDDTIAAFKKHYARRVRKGSNGLCFLAAAYAATGQVEKAHATMKAFLDKKPGRTIATYQHPGLYKRKEDLDRYLDLLRKAGMPE